MADMRGVAALQDELERAKESLKDVDDNIKKLTGRDPTEQRPSTRRVTAVPDGRGRERLFLQARWGPDEDIQAKRRIVGGAFSRLGPNPRMLGRGHPPRGRDSGDEDDLPNKPTIQSSVVATPKESRTRKDSIDEQKSDKKGNARNRRMFGLLLGTLRKFKDEAKETQDKEVQRKQIEQKLEEKAKLEKEDLKKERRQLFLERKQKQAKIRRLEYRMELVETHNIWEREICRLKNFVQTKAKPQIFYLPKELDPVLSEKMKDTVRYVQELIDDRKKRLASEIEDLMALDQGDEGVGDGDEELEEEEETGDRQTDKENRRRKSSGHREELRRHSGEGVSHRVGRDKELSRKRRKSESVADNDRHSRAGKHRRKSKEDGDRDRSGGRRDSHKLGSSRKDDKSKDRTEPRVEINYSDEEEEEEGELRNDPPNNKSAASEFVDMLMEDRRSVEQSKNTGIMETNELNEETERQLKQSKAMMAEDEEEGEVHDAIDE